MRFYVNTCLSDPDNYPSYTAYIQELIQNSMIDLFSG